MKGCHIDCEKCHLVDSKSKKPDFPSKYINFKVMSLTASPKRESGANKIDHHFLRNATTQSGLKKTDFKGSKIDFKGLEEIVIIREDLNRKKTFSFGHCPNHLTPSPIWATWSSFLDVKNDVLRV